ncbi:hypothetical protein D3C72_1268230 [compost metagenome]
MPVHTVLKASPCASASTTSARPSPSADNASRLAYSAANLPWITSFERSSPLLVTLNGRPNGLNIALTSDTVTASDATICVTSVKIGSARWPVIQML